MKAKRGYALLLALLLVLTSLLTACGGDNGGNASSTLYTYNSSSGLVTSDADGMDTVPDGQQVTLRADAYAGYSFAGWTTDAYLENYGTLVSEEAEYTFTKQGDAKYYANFVQDNQVYVCYYANGGTIQHDDAQGDRLIQKISLGNHPYPATLAQQDTFLREGYVLTEYNEKADGTGEATNIGQRAFSDQKIIHLYAQWSNATGYAAFDFEKNGDGWYITGYNSKDKELTIPAQHEGLPVIGIAQNAVSSASVTKLVLPETITTIQDGAFSGCSSLKTVYLYDSVTEMTDKSFSGCPIETVCLNSVFDKKYTAEGTGKLELLHTQKNASAHRLVVISGSSGIFSLDSEQLQTFLTKEYQVVNFGLQITVPNSLVMQVIKPYLHEGDAVLLAPECEFKQFNNLITTMTFIRLDGAFTSLRHVDVSQYDAFFTALSAYASAKSVDTENLLDNDQQFYSANGDANNTHETEAFPATYQFKDPTKRAEMTDAVYRRYNQAIDGLKEHGVTVYLSFAPFSSEACVEPVTKQQLEDYSKALAAKLHAVCISSQADHDYPVQYFFEMFHMTAEGKQLRTEQLIKELNAQFEKEN